MKKFLSTTAGRLTAVVVVILLLYAVSQAVNRTVPFLILSALKSGSIKPTRSGAFRLPWYWSFAAVDGIAIASRVGGITVVLLPQDAASDANFTGLLVADKVIPPLLLTPCPSGATCTQVTASNTASEPDTFQPTSVNLKQIGSSRLYDAQVDVAE